MHLLAMAIVAMMIAVAIGVILAAFMAAVVSASAGGAISTIVKDSEKSGSLLVKPLLASILLGLVCTVSASLYELVIHGSPVLSDCGYFCFKRNYHELTINWDHLIPRAMWISAAFFLCIVSLQASTAVWSLLIMVSMGAFSVVWANWFWPKNRVPWPEYNMGTYATDTIWILGDPQITLWALFALTLMPMVYTLSITLSRFWSSLRYVLFAGVTLSVLAIEVILLSVSAFE